MKCQKCAKSAIVHLTEILTDKDAGAQRKRAVEMHLCLDHAMEAGLVVAAPHNNVIAQTLQSPAAQPETSDAPGAIVPAHVKPADLAIAHNRTGKSSDPFTCSACGMSWTQFKQGGLMGCPHDYDMFHAKLVPLLKRAQEGATDHIGKVPLRKQSEKVDRQVTRQRFNRELRKAIHTENYEQAAKLRDQLRQLDQDCA